MVIMMSTIEKLKKLIDEAEVVVIGAGAGLSSAAGFEYGGDFFKEHFPEMHKLGYKDMYSAGFHHFNSSGEKWAYWAKQIFYTRYQGVKELYKDLLDVVKDKNYFVITTNVDHQFQLAGFDKNRLFYTQGDYGLFQCSTPCHNKTYDNEDFIHKMLKETKDNKIPSYLIPKCPICGKEMTTNLRCDDKFVEDDGWHKAAKNYQNFLEDNKNKKILFLELGVGWNTPVIIKYPFIRMTHQFNNAYYACINKGDNYVPDEIKSKSLIVNEDIKKLIELIKK